MGLFLYNILLPFYLLIALPGLLIKMRRRGGYGSHFMQRFAHYDAARLTQLQTMKNTWWIHAVSVGEVFIALKLIDAIRREKPEIALVLSTTSSTGYATASENAPESVLVLYNPLDVRWIVRRALRVIQPSIVVLMESEIWPNLITLTERQGIPCVIANARLSPRSERRYRKFRSLVAPTLERLTKVLTQEEEDVSRWQNAGVPIDRLTCTGSVKFDPASVREPSEAQREQIGRILSAYWGKRFHEYKFLLLGSSHAGEEAAVAQMVRALRSSCPDIRLLAVPRHFERAGTILEELDALDLKVERRSHYPDHRLTDADPDVLLVDSTGELAAWYTFADVVMVGKSFLSEGGQNPVEPILAGKPVIVGPHMENFESLTKTLVAENGVVQVDSINAAGPVVQSWAEDREGAEAVVEAGRRVLGRHAGASARTVEKLLAIVKVSA